MLEVQNRDGAVVMLWHPSPRLTLPAPQSVPSQPTFLKSSPIYSLACFLHSFSFVFFSRVRHLWSLDFPSTLPPSLALHVSEVREQGQQHARLPPPAP